MITIQRALDKAEPALRRAFLRMIQAMKDALPLEELATMLSSGRFEEALNTVLSASGKLGTAYNAGLVASAESVAAQLEEATGALGIDFDTTNYSAVDAMQRNRLRLVTNFNQTQREVTRRALIDGITRGANPIEQARAFRDSIGLTVRQERWVANYRRSLELGRSDALDRRLRDHRFDSRVRAAVEGDRPLSAKQVDRMVARYRERQLKYRADRIARTEALKSVHEGQDLALRQNVEGGQLQGANLERIWNTAKDERTRPSHMAMHQQIRGYEEPFTSGAGHQAMYPGAFGVGSEDIHCRCVVSVRVKEVSLAGI